MITFNNCRYEREGFKLSISLSIAPASCTAVVGPSGAGKSTLLNLIAGFDDVVTGQILLDGCDHTTTEPSQRPLNFVFQDHNSFSHISTRRNVAFGISPSLQLSALQWQQVDDALEQVGILHLKDRMPGDMSGGERQRIALARALIRPKPILLLDEAFAALGPALRQDMLEQIKQLQLRYSLTVVMVTHTPEDAQRIADHTIFIGNGVVQKPVVTTDFFSSSSPEIRAYLGTAALPA